MSSTRTKAIAVAAVTTLAVVGLLVYQYLSRPALTNAVEPLGGRGAGAGHPKSQSPAHAVEDVESEEEEDEEEESESGDDDNDGDDEESGAKANKQEETEEEGTVEENLEKALAEAVAEQQRQQKKKEEEELKQKYDSAVNMAKKFFSGNEFVKAAAKYKEAIELATFLPSAQKDLVVLYNNSSAMYEKAKMWADALLDSNVVLSMDPRHTKARIRRSRVYEATNQKLDAFNDLVCTMMIEQIMAHASGQQPNYNQQLNKDIERLNRDLAMIEANKMMNKLLNCGPSDKPFDIPSKTLCVNFLESFPSYYLYKEKLAKADRDELKTTFANAVNTATETHPRTLETYTQALNALMDLIHVDLVNARIQKAFDTLTSEQSMAVFEEVKRLVAEYEAAQPQSQTQTQDATEQNENESTTEDEHKNVETPASQTHAARQLLSQHLELRGLQLNMHCNYTHALALYAEAVATCADNVEASLKMAQILLDIGKDTEAVELYDKLVASTNAQPLSGKQQNQLAWIYVHRFSACTVKNQFGLYNLEVLSQCLADLKKGLQCLTAAETLGYTTEDVKGCKFINYLKQQQGIAQIKPSVTSFDVNHPATTSEEDKAALQHIVAQAKALYPEHPMLLLLAIDSAPQDSDALNSSMEAVEAAVKTADPDNTYPLMVKGTILSQKIFQVTDELSYHAAVRETEQCFQEVIEKDPTSINAYISLVQIKSMKPNHDLSDSVKLLEAALKHARNKDEMVDATTQLVICRAQARALEDIKQF